MQSLADIMADAHAAELGIDRKYADWITINVKGNGTGNDGLSKGLFGRGIYGTFWVPAHIQGCSRPRQGDPNLQRARTHNLNSLEPKENPDERLLHNVKRVNDRH